MASIVHISMPIFVAVLAATIAEVSAAAVSSNSNVNKTTALTAGAGNTGALPAAAKGSAQEYTCYLCQKQKARMIRRCPIAQDDCHVACLNLPTPSAPPAPPKAGGARGDDDCYVTKVYPDRSWVVVDVVSCRASGGCYLKCDSGNGTTTPAATTRGFLPNDLPPFERCGN